MGNHCYKVIKIIDPILCVRCNNAYIADVKLTSGRIRKMFYCSRFDCDNWVSLSTSSDQEVDKVEIDHKPDVPHG